MEHRALWAILSCGLADEDGCWLPRVGDTFESGLSIVASTRSEAQSFDGLELLDIGRGVYRATGVAKTPAFTWILEVGNLRLVTYQDPPGPIAGRRYSLVGTLMVSWDYEWDVAMEPSEGGGPFDGRRRWRVTDIRIGRLGLSPVDRVPRWPDTDYCLSLLPAD